MFEFVDVGTTPNKAIISNVRCSEQGPRSTCAINICRVEGCNTRAVSFTALNLLASAASVVFVAAAATGPRTANYCMSHLARPVPCRSYRHHVDNVL